MISTKINDDFIFYNQFFLCDLCVSSEAGVRKNYLTETAIKKCQIILQQNSCLRFFHLLSPETAHLDFGTIKTPIAL